MISLDDKYIMGSEVADEVLLRRVPAQEIAESRNLWDFWVAPSMESQSNSSPPESSGGLSNVASKKGPCLSALKLTGMVQWGKRRQVRFLDRHEESKHNPLSSSEKEENEYFCEDEDEEVEEEEEEVEEEEVEEEEDMKKGGLKVGKTEEEVVPEARNYCRSKRKLHSKNRKTQKPKPAKRQKQNQSIVYNKSNKKVVKNSIDRWSAARYKLAEENMLKIMKAKGAVCGKPILRPVLRSEARKLIGDTGLLDHLLKHMAGKVAPGGAERFRRRHNSDGVMEYWLESADLVNIRREAGVQDPYWTPPPGWQPGDNPTQDPFFARELKEFREEMTKMQKDMQELASRKQEEDLTIVSTPNSTVRSLQWDHEGSLLTPKMLIKVAPCGAERFREQHNSDEAMEYWLQSADLVSTRKEAGVQDPYWTPLPEQPVDNPVQDPVCARELKELREGMAKMKKDMQELVSRKQEEDLIIVTAPNSTITSLQLDHEGSLLTSKEMYMDLLNRNGKIEEQMKEISQELKPAKLQKQNQNIVHNRSEKKAVKNSIERWSAARYKLAEENMLKIMKAKGAVCGNPILRPALRSEARKLIGDTGLLDHLLKHMAGKVAPGGAERFRRWHNSDGVMEYWLESADLVNIRREAGVQDPYWTPPPGWQPGDNPAQDPVCARELKELREEMAKMKKNMQELASRKQEEDLLIVTTPNSMVTSLQCDHEGSLLTPKEMYMDLVNRKGKIEEQMKEISQCLSGMKKQQRQQLLVVLPGLPTQLAPHSLRQRSELFPEILSNCHVFISSSSTVRTQKLAATVNLKKVFDRLRKCSLPPQKHIKLGVRGLATQAASPAYMVKAIRVHELGGPEVMKWEDVEIGEPNEGEIRVKNKAIGLNFIDVYFRKGVYKADTFPFTPGIEAVGVVTAVGPGLTGRQVGDIVAYVGLDTVAYAASPLGSYAEEQILPANKVVPVPSSIDPVIAASVILKGMTAQFLLRRCFKVEAGHTILVHAAAGGVGSLLCQWANALGATVIGTVSTKEKAAQAKDDGAHHVINYKEEDFVARVNEITSGNGVDVVYDSVGKDTFQGSLACLKLCGHMVSFGKSSGAPDPVPLSALTVKSLFLTWTSLMHYTTTRDEILETAGEVFANVASGVLRVRVNHTYPLSQAAQAHADLEGRKTSGSVVLIP